MKAMGEFVEDRSRRAPSSTQAVPAAGKMASRAARQRKITVTDGPFTESKGGQGWAIVGSGSKAEAISGRHRVS